MDATQKLGIHFKHEASPTSKKYLLETMGSGVALFDYDNDGRLDIFFANGAHLSDPMPKGAFPKKDDPKYWNRLYHQKPDGTFEDVTEKAGLSGVGYSTGVAVGDYDNDGNEDLFVAGYGRSTLYHNNGNGTFTDVTDAAGVAGSGWATKQHGWIMTMTVDWIWSSPATWNGTSTTFIAARERRDTAPIVIPIFSNLFLFFFITMMVTVNSLRYPTKPL
ncbi:MAG TPA: VCBS repeat-containing protein [Terriglobales bacterium]|nr:VCBS repeat-containing protein [Terriglobales bacterium]